MATSNSKNIAKYRGRQMGPTICFPEGDDEIIKDAVLRSCGENDVQAMVWTNDPSAYTGSKNVKPIKLPQRFDQAAYQESISMVISGEADGMIAGAHASKDDLVRLLANHCRRLIVTRIYGIAIGQTLAPQEKLFFMIDPIARPHPSGRVLCEAAMDAAKYFARLYGRIPQAFYISYTNNSSALKRDSKGKIVIEGLKRSGLANIFEYPVQLDVAMNDEIRRDKLGFDAPSADLIIFPDLTTANAVYKTMALFGDNRIKLSGGVIRGFSKGIFGVVSRSSDPGEASRMISFILQDYHEA